jgi:lipoyl(octanoyl) transferase
MQRRLRVYNLLESKELEYLQVWKYQKALAKETFIRRKAELPTDDHLILVQHQPVYTMGRAANPENIKFQPQHVGAPPVYRIERGGDVTFHGPGQIVAYPIFDLSEHKRDLHW